MLIKSIKRWHAREQDVTSEEAYLRFKRQRRRLLAGAAGLAGGAMMPSALAAYGGYGDVSEGQAPEWLDAKVRQAKWKAVTPGPNDALTPFDDVTHYNNFYEFGSGKTDPAANSGTLKPEPWSVVIDGEVAKPGKLALEDIIGSDRLEERIYRMRCVEAWSMVIPWLGIPLADLLKRVQPTSKARYVAFQTLDDPAQMPGQASSTAIIDWPYREGLRLDEAMNPLTLMTVGLYGRALPNQDGAPLRLIVPWKYGFKGIKSIVRISLMSEQPQTSWNQLAANEYGFYANVNPHVDHPRWSQAHERRLPNSLFHPNIIPTQMFNGYGEEVASLYKGMNLRRNF